MADSTVEADVAKLKADVASVKAAIAAADAKATSWLEAHAHAFVTGVLVVVVAWLVHAVL